MNKKPTNRQLKVAIDIFNQKSKPIFDLLCNIEKHKEIKYTVSPENGVRRLIEEKTNEEKALINMLDIILEDINRNILNY